jgi:hypothetical protein
MPPNDEDLFKPLSAKVGRKQFSSGGREIEAGRARMGDGNRVRQVLLRRDRDATKQKKGVAK